MNTFKGRHFQRDIILWAVRWYCKYCISYRELQEMLAERGVNVDHSTIYRWYPTKNQAAGGVVNVYEQGALRCAIRGLKANDLKNYLKEVII